MTRGNIASALVVSVVAAVNLAGCGQSNPTVPVEKARAAATNPNATTIDPDGTAHITRVIPLPASVSSEARALLATGASWCPQEGTKAQLALIEQARAMYQVTVEQKTIGGVPTKIVSPLTRVPRDRDRVLINLHGGGFVEDSGSMLESIPVAALTGLPVITVYYRLLPTHPWPAQVDDAVAVYRELLKTYHPLKIGLYGTSAGATLSASTVVRLRQLGLPVPAALGFFSSSADMARNEDSGSFFGVKGLADVPVPKPPDPNDPANGGRPLDDRVLSPIYADLKAFPRPCAWPARATSC
jgi:epsilon-lactone hydrolase